MGMDRLEVIEAKATIPLGLKFVFGGSAGMLGTLFVQPMDLVKTRMQMAGAGTGKREFNNSWECVMSVLRNEGFFALYNGLSAGLLRQATYTTARLGAYNYLIDAYKARYEQSPTVGATMAMGLGAGAFGAFVGTPADLALIRMASDGRLPPAERRNYSNVFDALFRVVREEGVTACWRGSIPTVVRAMIVNMTQLASYTQLKDLFASMFSMKEGLGLHVCASMSSGFLTTITSMPLDIAKTRIQNQKTVDGKAEYKGTMDVLFKVARHEGPFALWKGFTPYFCRLGPHTVLTFVFLEQMNAMYFRFKAKGKEE